MYKVGLCEIVLYFHVLLKTSNNLSVITVTALIKC